MPAYQNKRTKKWQFRVYAEDSFGNKRQYERSGFKTKKDAQNAEIEFLLSNKETTEYITFKELWESYNDHIYIKLKPQSYRSVASRFTSYIIPYFGEYRIDKITTRLYTKWQRELEEKGFKFKYNSNLHGAMVSILNYGIKFYNLTENIASKTGNFTRKRELTKKVDFWTLAEYLKFISVVDDQIYQASFETLYYTGLRQGEALALTWKDFYNNKLDVNKTISKEQVNGQYCITDPKTRKSIRIIKIDDTLNQTLLDLLDYFQTFEGFNTDWYIFGGIEPIAPTTIGRKKELYCKLANVKKIRIHDFRHSHASLLLSKGVPITVISQRLGHSDINMTLNTYSHMMPNDEDKAVDMINGLRDVYYEKEKSV